MTEISVNNQSIDFKPTPPDNSSKVKTESEGPKLLIKDKNTSVSHKGSIPASSLSFSSRPADGYKAQNMVKTLVKGSLIGAASGAGLGYLASRLVPGAGKAIIGLAAYTGGTAGVVSQVVNNFEEVEIKLKIMDNLGLNAVSGVNIKEKIGIGSKDLTSMALGSLGGAGFGLTYSAVLASSVPGLSLMKGAVVGAGVGIAVGALQNFLNSKD